MAFSLKYFSCAISLLGMLSQMLMLSFYYICSVNTSKSNSTSIACWVISTIRTKLHLSMSFKWDLAFSLQKLSIAIFKFITLRLISPDISVPICTFSALCDKWMKLHSHLDITPINAECISYKYVQFSTLQWVSIMLIPEFITNKYKYLHTDDLILTNSISTRWYIS